MNVVGTIFLKDNKLLLVKPTRRPTYQMVGGKVEEGETIKDAAVRECHEELGKNAIFDESKFTFLMDFDEIASSDNKTKIHFYLFIYYGNLEGKLEESDEISRFIWYETGMGNNMLSNTLKHKVIPYCVKEKLIS